MKPYFDLGFLLVLLVKNKSTSLAWELAHRFDAPLPFNTLHQLHIENALSRQLYESKLRLRKAAREGLTEWRNKLAEAVFLLNVPEWEIAFRQAVLWNSQLPGRPPHSPFLLHAALATTGSTTHFLSFDLRTRPLAQNAGLKLLPESL